MRTELSDQTLIKIGINMKIKINNDDAGAAIQTACIMIKPKHTKPHDSDRRFSLHSNLKSVSRKVCVHIENT